MSLPTAQSLSITSYCERNGHTPAAGTGRVSCLHCAEPLTVFSVVEPPPVVPADTTDEDGWHTVDVTPADGLQWGNGADEGATKSSNPKDIIGSRKLDVGLVPDTLVVCAANGFLEGALKYGRFNWRICGVAASIYHAAVNRHIKKWWNGQDADPKTLVHHLDNAISGLGILRDAMLYGMLTDDRPPCPDPDAMARAIDEGEAMVAHLKELFKDHAPHQFTIADTRQPEEN